MSSGKLICLLIVVQVAVSHARLRGRSSRDTQSKTFSASDPWSLDTAGNSGSDSDTDIKRPGGRGGQGNPGGGTGIPGRSGPSFGPIPRDSPADGNPRGPNIGVGGGRGWGNGVGTNPGRGVGPSSGPGAGGNGRGVGPGVGGAGGAGGTGTNTNGNTGPATRPRNPSAGLPGSGTGVNRGGSPVGGNADRTGGVGGPGYDARGEGRGGPPPPRGGTPDQNIPGGPIVPKYGTKPNVNGGGGGTRIGSRNPSVGISVGGSNPGQSGPGVAKTPRVDSRNPSGQPRNPDAIGNNIAQIYQNQSRSRLFTISLIVAGLVVILATAGTVIFVLLKRK